MYGFERSSSITNGSKFPSSEDDEIQLEESGDETEEWVFKYKKPDNSSWLNPSFDKEDGVVLTLYLNWSFRTTFTNYMLSAVLQFILLLILFTIVIYVYGRFAPTACFSGADKTKDTLWAHSFALSWTTFSTVGYGHTYPIIEDECAFITVVTVIESFVGVLYAGFCGAILFGKVTRVYSNAKVKFSDFFVIRFGAGVDNEEDDDDFEELDTAVQLNNPLVRPGVIGLRHKSLGSSPFPMLVFRVVNDLSNEKKYGSIMNTTIEATAIIASRKMDHDDSLPKKRFHSLDIQPSTIPMFKKVVYVRHRLNTNSPLLRRDAKKMIEKNNGKWPVALNNAASIREQLNFEEMLITLEGTSDISKSSVISHKEYKHTEGKIGWQFIGMTFKDGDKDTRVRFDLLNDLVEQKGGGGERLDGGDTTKRTQASVVEAKPGFFRRYSN